MAPAEDKIEMLVDTLMVVHEDNVRLRTLIERQAHASEGTESHLNTTMPAILTALGIVQAKQKSDDDTAAIKLWDRFAKAPANVRWSLIALVAIVAAAGWAIKLGEWFLH